MEPCVKYAFERFKETIRLVGFTIISCENTNIIIANKYGELQRVEGKTYKNRLYAEAEISGGLLEFDIREYEFKIKFSKKLADKDCLSIQFDMTDIKRGFNDYFRQPQFSVQLILTDVSGVRHEFYYYLSTLEFLINYLKTDDKCQLLEERKINLKGVSTFPSDAFRDNWISFVNNSNPLCFERKLEFGFLNEEGSKGKYLFELNIRDLKNSNPKDNATIIEYRGTAINKMKNTISSHPYYLSQKTWFLMRWNN